MSFKLMRNKKGIPTHVHINNGYMETSRKFDEDTDGWMEDQLNPSDFLAVRIGREMESLIKEINYLRRENFRLTKSEERWDKAFKQ